MKRVLSTLALSVVLAAGSVYGQAATLVADIPFAFQVGKKVMPAGTYEVVEGITASGAILLKSRTSDAKAFVLTIGSQKNQEPEEGSLTFHRYGNKYFLSSIWKPGNLVGRELPTTPAEREMAKNSASLELASVRVYIAQR